MEEAVGPFYWCGIQPNYLVSRRFIRFWASWPMELPDYFTYTWALLPYNMTKIRSLCATQINVRHARLRIMTTKAYKNCFRYFITYSIELEKHLLKIQYHSVVRSVK